MKNILIFPPQWMFLSPHYSLTALGAHLKHNNVPVDINDLNIEFYQHILSSESIKKSLNKIDETFEREKKVLIANFSPNQTIDDIPLNIQMKIKQVLKIKELKTNHKHEMVELESSIQRALEIMKDKEKFYSLKDMLWALQTIDRALYLYSLPYYPSEISIYNYQNPLIKYTFEGIKKDCLDFSNNIFYSFYKEFLPKIVNKNPDFIGISIGAYCQVTAGLTLAHLLKTNTNAHINIGGNYFSRVAESFKNTPEFFTLFADSVIVEEGERPLLELIESLQGRRDIKNVSNLIYSDKDNTIKFNPKTEPVILNEMAIQNLDDYTLNSYLMPEIVLPIVSSRGCYWKKCTFCDHYFGQTYNLKDVEKLVDEIKILNEKYGIKHFEFIDEAISASYIKEFSLKVIESGLKIDWYCNARLESDFTPEIFEISRKAGLRMILWGVESGSERIMEMINKGVDLEKRLDILKAAKEADIWNYAYIFYGFPSETKEDANKTLELVCQNTNLITSYGRSHFDLGKHALINNDSERFGIIKLHNDEEFSAYSKFKRIKGLSEKELNDFVEYFKVKAKESYDNPAWMYIRYRETLFLYVCKYGLEAVKNMKVVLG